MKFCDKCNICSQRLLNYKTYLKCTMCCESSHPKCNYLSKNEAEQLKLATSWTCLTCTKETFPFFDDYTEPPTTNNYNKINCYSCSKVLGMQIFKCEICNNNIHKRCKLENSGCKKCRDDIFPASCDLFSNDENKILFDPYNPDSPVNKIGTAEEFDDDHEHLNMLSKNLRKCKYTPLSALEKPTQNDFNVLSLNIRSLKSNFHKLKDDIENLQKFDALCLCETNIDPEETLMGTHDLYSLEGFNSPIFQKPSRNSNRGGGLAIYINSNKFDDDCIKILDHINVTESPDTGEFLFVEINTGVKNKNIILGNFYRSPSYTPDFFISKLGDIHSALKKDSNKHIILMGDANIDMIQHENCQSAQNYFNVMSQHGYIPVISRPTRITDHSMTLIDHIFTNCVSNFVRSGILQDHYADHLGVYIKISLNVPLKFMSKGNYQYAEFSEAKTEEFQKLIRNAN